MIEIKVNNSTPVKLIKRLIIFSLLFNLNNISYAKDPSALINEIVDNAASILSSEDPVESKIIKFITTCFNSSCCFR